MRKLLINIASKLGMLEPYDDYEQKIMLHTSEMLHKSIDRAMTYADLKSCEDSAKVHFLFRFENSEPLYKLIINHIQIRIAELAADKVEI